MHLFLTGSVQIGKTTALNKTLELLKVIPGGFRSYFGEDRKSPCRYLYMSSPAEPRAFTPDHAIVKFGQDENGAPVRTILPSFEELGLQYLSEASSYPIIVLDECGRHSSCPASGHGCWSCWTGMRQYWALSGRMPWAGWRIFATTLRYS